MTDYIVKGKTGDWEVVIGLEVCGQIVSHVNSLYRPRMITAAGADL